jgi:hypothetical protein
VLTQVSYLQLQVLTGASERLLKELVGVEVLILLLEVSIQH